MSADVAAMRALSDPQPLSQDVADSLVRLLDLARDNIEADRTAAGLSIARAAALLRIEIERKAAGGEPAGHCALAGWQMHRVRAYIDANLDAPIRVSDLAALARLSSSYFCRAFKQTFRETPHAFILGRRLHRARELMLTTDDSLSQIAVACGLSDQAHLCRVFRARHDHSPAAWRRERRDHVGKEPGPPTVGRGTRIQPPAARG